MLKILLLLVEIDRRRLYLPLGYGSLFEFCRGRLGYSEPSACRCVASARCIRNFPPVYDLLAAGRTSFSAIARISRVLSAENFAELVREIEGKSARQFDSIVARRRPQSAIRERVRPVWVPAELCVERAQGDNPGRKDTGEVNSTFNVDGKKFTTAPQAIYNLADTDLPTAKCLPRFWQTPVIDNPAQAGGGTGAAGAGPSRSPSAQLAGGASLSDQSACAGPGGQEGTWNRIFQPKSAP